MYRTRMMAPPNNLTLDQAELVMQRIVPWEILHGERFNVNRLLGNGRNDPAPTDPYGVVDDPFEADTGEVIWPAGLPGGYAPGSYVFNYFNDDPVFTIDVPTAGISAQAPLPSFNRFAPQIYARHLYCLMLALSDFLDNSYFYPTAEDLSAILPIPPNFLPGNPNRAAEWDAVKRRELMAHRIAQWAVNVVDFRDANAIMTPFEYDVNPFNGWQTMDGDPRTTEGG
jgi:hypothetical protein